MRSREFSRFLNCLIGKKRRRAALAAAISAAMAMQIAMPVFAEGEPPVESNVIFSEDFEGTAGTDLDGYNGWALRTGDLTKYTLDSQYTIAAEEENTENGVGKFYRSVSNASSASALIQQTFETPIDGGIVDLDFRINRKTGTAKQFLIQYFDGAGKMMEFVVDLQNSRILPNSACLPQFNRFYFDGVTSNRGYTIGKWLGIKIRLDLDGKTFDFYQDGKKIAEKLPLIENGDGKISSVRIGTNRNMNNTTEAYFYLDDFAFTRYAAKITDEEGCALTADSLTSLFETPLTDNIELPLKGVAGTAIEWSSADPDIVSSAGEVNRLFMQEQTTQLTAKLTKGGYSQQYVYNVTVAAITEIAAPTQELMQKAADRFTFAVISEDSAHGVKRDLNLVSEYGEGTAALFGGMNIKWSSSNPELVTSAGTVHGGTKSENVKLTAVLTAKDDETISATKDFDITVLPGGESYLYETFDTPESEAGQSVQDWNGWTMSIANLDVYTLDSFFTLINEGDTQNRLLSLYRSDVNSKSAYTTTAKKLETAADGGEVSIKFRTMVNSKAKRMLLHLDDTDGVQEEFVIDFGNSRIYAGQSGLFPYIYFNGTGSAAAAANTWYTFEIIINYDRNVFDFYIDGNKIASGQPLKPNSGKLARVGFGTVRNSVNLPDAQFFVDDLFVTRAADKISDISACENVAEELRKSDGMVAEHDFPLTINGDYKSKIVWTSSDKDLIKVENGKAVVTRPDSDAEVTLTAKIVRGNASLDCSVRVTVPKMEEKIPPTQQLVDSAAEGFTISDFTDEKYMMITKDLSLPKVYKKGYAKKIGGLNVAWKSSRPGVITDEGIITKQKYDAAVTLTAEFSAVDDPSLKATKEFNLMVLSESDIIMYDGFDEADISDMYKTVDFNGWTLTEGASNHVVATDTQVVLDPTDPQDTVLNFKRTQKYNPAVQPYPGIVFTYKELGQEVGEGTLYITTRFLLENLNSRISFLFMDTKEKFSSTGTNINTTYGANAPMTPGVVKLNRWHTATIVMKLSGNVLIPHSYDVFVDGTRLNKNQLRTANGYPIYALAVYSPRTSDGPNSCWYADDIMVRLSKYNEADAVREDAAELQIPDEEEIKSDIDLPREGPSGTRIVWTSSDKKIISDGGRVYLDGAPHEVTLTATVIKGACSEQRSFKLNVAADAAYSYEAMALEREGGIIKGVKVKNLSFSGNARVILKLYSKGSLADIRVLTLSAGVGEEQTVEFAKPINTADYLKYETEAYVYDIEGGKTISKILR